MIHELIVVFEEIYSEILHELTVYPVRMLLEAIQFLLLLVIIWVVAMGTRKRRGFVANMLAERDERVRGRLEEASHAEERLVASTELAQAKTAKADSEAEGLLSDARLEAEQITAQAAKDADTEAERIISRAESALATERAEMEMEIREELVDLVAQATRTVMSEKVSLDEQRHLIERAIVVSIGPEPEREKPAKPVARSVRKPRSVMSGVRADA
jgi:F-type H+-transporting ATPase subunit b